MIVIKVIADYLCVPSLNTIAVKVPLINQEESSVMAKHCLKDLSCFDSSKRP